MQNTFEQSGIDSKMFLKKSFFRIGTYRYIHVELETPPPFMEKPILNFHFDYLNPSLSQTCCFIFVLSSKYIAASLKLGRFPGHIVLSNFQLSLIIPLLIPAFQSTTEREKETETETETALSFRLIIFTQIDLIKKSDKSPCSTQP